MVRLLLLCALYPHITYNEKTITYSVHYHRLSGALRSDGIRGHMQVTMDYGSRHSGNGGEFNAYVSRFWSRRDGLRPDRQSTPPDPGTGFETFCMEVNEHFNPGSTYYYGISQAAIQWRRS